MGVSLVRITIDTREDSYQDALGVLRRAYGRHRVARKSDGSDGSTEAADPSQSGASQQESGKASESDGRKDAGPKARATKGTKRPAAKRTSATRAAAVESSVAKSTAKRAPGRKRAAPGVAANTAPRGESEAVRAWAQDQGMQVRARGRMPAKVIAAYLEAHAD